ncbi:MAG: OmpA family protein [Pseudonocardiaceae bacterium]
MTDHNTLPAELDNLTQELTLARATDLARAGHYVQAERLLTTPAGVPVPAQLDLLARIYAQQGKLAEADTCWAQAAEASHDSGAYQSERQRLATLKRRRFGDSRGLRRVGFGVLAAAVLAAVALPWLPGGPGARSPDDVPPGQVQQNAQRLSDIDRRIQDSQHLVSSIATESSSPTTRVRAGQGSVALSFTIPLFRGGAVALTPEGEAALSDLGRRLASHAGKISVSVVGHTEDAAVDPGGRYQDDADLALGRALAAAQRLSAAIGIPLQGIAMSSAGRDDPPFPNDTSDDRARNRTVTLTIAPSPL